MDPTALEKAAQIASAAADRARSETLPRFRHVDTEFKADGSPVTEADRGAEQAIRAVLRDATPDYGIIGEEFGSDELPDRPCWIVDPIDGTLAFSRGIPLYSTLIALVEDGRPVLGLIDLPTLGERFVGWRGAGCRLNGHPVQVSTRSDLQRSIVSHGDVYCFDEAGQRGAWERLAREVPFLRGYTDAFGHAQVLSGGVDAMIDFDLNIWDAAASQVLVEEAGGRVHTLTQSNGKLGLILGSPTLVEQLLGFLDP